MYNRIVVAVDGSESALRATQEAMKLASASTDGIIEYANREKPR